MIGVQPKVAGFDCLSSDLLHVLNQLLDVVEWVLRVCHLEITLQLGIRQLVAGLVLAVVLTELLDGVVGEVHHRVAQVLQLVWLRGCSDVALLIPVRLEHSANASDQTVRANIKLPALVEE